ncbi:MAG TPA: helix-turn-helix domain-containing protein [Candidatus Acidoferrum sp.]
MHRALLRPSSPLYRRMASAARWVARSTLQLQREAPSTSPSPSRPLWQAGSAGPCPPRVSQETLAEMIGTTRSRVNFFVNKFRKLGFIEYNGKIKVNKSLLTVVLHE